MVVDPEKLTIYLLAYRKDLNDFSPILRCRFSFCLRKVLRLISPSH
jgi:hypothetical protein